MVGECEEISLEKFGVSLDFILLEQLLVIWCNIHVFLFQI